MIRDVIAERLKFFRERSNLTIYDVGEKIGKSGKTISAWENGRGQPDADMLLALCEIYNIKSIGELYGEEPPQQLSSLSSRDSALIKKYHLLNEDGQKKIEERMEELLEVPKYQVTLPDSPVAPIESDFLSKPIPVINHLLSNNDDKESKKSG